MDGEASASYINTASLEGFMNDINARQYRINEEFTIAAGGSLVYKFFINTHTELTFSAVEVDQGGVKYSVFSSAQTAETAPFNTPVSVYKRDLISNPIANRNLIFKGGTATFSGVSNSVVRVRTSSGNSGRASTVAQTSNVRGFPKGIVVYVQFAALDGINTTSTGVWSLEFEEIGVEIV